MNYLGESLVSSLGGGDLQGPASSTLNAIPRFGGTTGKTLKNSVVTVSDTGRMQGVSALETDSVENNTSVSLQSPEIEIYTPTSSAVLNTNVNIDTHGRLTLTGRASPTAIAINGATLLTGSLSLTGQILMNGSSQIKGVALPTMPQDAATKQYVDNVAAVKWAQLLFNNIPNLPLFFSGQLSLSVYNRLLVLNDPIPPNYFISSFNINPLDNVGFILTSVGTYKIRYRIGVKSDNATVQTLSVLLRIGGINRFDTEQFMPVSNAAITYHDFEYIFTITIPDIDILLFAKVSHVPDTKIETSYLCFNVIEI